MFVLKEVVINYIKSYSINIAPVDTLSYKESNNYDFFFLNYKKVSHNYNSFSFVNAMRFCSRRCWCWKIKLEDYDVKNEVYRHP